MTTADLVEAATGLRSLLALVERGEVTGPVGMATFLAGVLAGVEVLTSPGKFENSNVRTLR